VVGGRGPRRRGRVRQPPLSLARRALIRSPQGKEGGKEEGRKEGRRKSSKMLAAKFQSLKLGLQ